MELISDSVVASRAFTFGAQKAMLPAAPDDRSIAVATNAGLLWASTEPGWGQEGKLTIWEGGVRAVFDDIHCNLEPK